jgi:hypothetical protein
LNKPRAKKHEKKKSKPHTTGKPRKKRILHAGSVLENLHGDNLRVVNYENVLMYAIIEVALYEWRRLHGAPRATSLIITANLKRTI